MRAPTFRSNYVPLRKGIRRHVLQERMVGGRFPTFVWMLQYVNPKWGGLVASAVQFTQELGLGKNTVHDAFQWLEDKEYILRAFEPGVKSKFPILVDKYQVTMARGLDKSRVGKWVDLPKTKLLYGIPEGPITITQRKKSKLLREAIEKAVKSPVYSTQVDLNDEDTYEVGDDVGNDVGYEVGDELGEDVGDQVGDELGDLYIHIPIDIDLNSNEKAKEAASPKPVSTPVKPPTKALVQPAPDTAVPALETLTGYQKTGIPEVPDPAVHETVQLATLLYNYAGRPSTWASLGFIVGQCKALGKVRQKSSYARIRDVLAFVYGGEGEFNWKPFLAGQDDLAAYFALKFPKMEKNFLVWQSKQESATRTSPPPVTPPPPSAPKREMTDEEFELKFAAMQRIH